MVEPDTTIIREDGDRRVREKFDRAKLASSIETACHSVGLATGLASDTANHVADTVCLWLADRPEVSSHDIRRIATQSLTIVSPEAAYLYKHHHTML